MRRSVSIGGLAVVLVLAIGAIGAGQKGNVVSAQQKPETLVSGLLREGHLASGNRRCHVGDSRFIVAGVPYPFLQTADSLLDRRNLQF